VPDRNANAKCREEGNEPMSSNEYSRVLDEMRPILEQFPTLPPDAPVDVTLEVLSLVDPWFERAGIPMNATACYGSQGWRPALGPWPSVDMLTGYLYENMGGGLPVEFVQVIIVLAYDISAFDDVSRGVPDAVPSRGTSRAIGTASPEVHHTLKAFGAFLVIAVLLWLTQWGIAGLLQLARGARLEHVLWIVAIALVLLRNPTPGRARFGHRSGWPKALVLVRSTTLLLNLLLLGAGLFLFRESLGIPGFGAMIVAAVAVGAAAMVRLERGTRAMSRLDVVLGLALVVGLVVRELAWTGTELTNANVVLATVGAIASLVGVTTVIRPLFRPFPPFDDPMKLVVGGGSAMAAALLFDAGLSLLSALAFLIIPTVVSIIELHLLISTASHSRRTRGTPAIEVLTGPKDELERRIRRIKGTYRRAKARELCDRGEEPNPEFLAHELTERLKQALQIQVGPWARGGEDLPDLLDGEVELARITYTETVRGEVASLRGIRAGDDVMALRLVDEYGTHFVLPFDRVYGSISTHEVMRIFVHSVPPPVTIEPYEALSEVFPDLEDALTHTSGRFHKNDEPRGIGSPLRVWFSRIMMGFLDVCRKAFELRGHSIEVDVRRYGFGAILISVLIITRVPALTPALWALLIPVPALVVRRVRSIGIANLKEESSALALNIVAAGVIGAWAFGVSFWLATVSAGTVVPVLYLAFRRGEPDYEFLDGL